jgi:hypothetical protein
MKAFNTFTLLLPTLTILMVFTGCVRQTSEKPITQLEIREIQSREFDTNDTKLVMKSMMNVLQDDGYIIKNAVCELGLLNAEKSIDVEDTFAATCMVILVSPNARWSKQQILEASANVSEYGSKTRIRMNFQTKTIDNFGCPKNVETVRNPKIYQDFFDKVSKGLFLQEQDI